MVVSAFFLLTALEHAIHPLPSSPSTVFLEVLRLMYDPGTSREILLDKER